MARWTAFVIVWAVVLIGRVVPVQGDCPNGACEPGENCLNCPDDCGGPCVCGNGEVEPGEDCDPPGSECPDVLVCRHDCTCPPTTNDDCDQAITIGTGRPFSTLGNSTDGLPHRDQCQFDGQTYHDDWFMHVTSFIEMTVSTCNNADYDTDLAVYDGCYPNLPCPPGDEYLLGCNDDGIGCAGFTSALTVDVTVGNCYTIRVGGWKEGDMGTGFLEIAEGHFDHFCGDSVCSGPETACTCPEDCPGTCPCVVFTDKAEFEVFNISTGKSLVGTENFEESVLSPGDVEGFDDSLCGGVPNSPDAFPFPDGLLVEDLCIQSNALPCAWHLQAPSPSGTDGLVAVSAGLFGAQSDIVVSNALNHATDLILRGQDQTAVGFDVISLLGGDLLWITPYDKNGDHPFRFYSAADAAGSHFFGVSCSVPLGRINICSGSGGGDNIQIWASAVDCGECPTDVDGSGDTGAADLAVLLGSWGLCAPGHECACLDADDDDIIGPFDLAVLLWVWGPCP